MQQTLIMSYFSNLHQRKIFENIKYLKTFEKSIFFFINVHASTSNHTQRYARLAMVEYTIQCKQLCVRMRNNKPQQTRTTGCDCLCVKFVERCLYRPVPCDVVVCCWRLFAIIALSISIDFNVLQCILWFAMIWVKATRSNEERQVETSVRTFLHVLLRAITGECINRHQQQPKTTNQPTSIQVYIFIFFSVFNTSRTMARKAKKVKKPIDNIQKILKEYNLPRCRVNLVRLNASGMWHWTQIMIYRFHNIWFNFFRFFSLIKFKQIINIEMPCFINMA